jgi:CheY-like chemotaxis protein
VLIVEDNAEHSMLLARLLADSPAPRFHVTETANLAAALAKLKAETFDVVLLDLSLPDSQEISTFEKASAAAPDVAIVVLSGISDVTVAMQTLQRGAQDYLVKGHVDNHLLLRSIQYAVERKQGQLALQRGKAELETKVQARTKELTALNQRLSEEIGERRKAEETALEMNRQLKEALEELRAMQGDLVRRERFQALAQMANGIAHEFNNILTPIVGFSEHLLSHPAIAAAPEVVRTNLERIKSAALTGSKAVSRVRDFAKAEAGEFGVIHTGELIESVIALTEPRWRDEALARGATISVVRDGSEAPEVTGDAAQLREALTHLVFNAVHAIGRKGQIRLGVEPRGGGVALSVEDDGRGMTEAQRRHCLDPKASAGALERRLSGFAVIHAIAARHHGRLEIETAEGKGTKVSLVLPAAPKMPDPEPIIAVHPEAPGSLRILVADDEPMVREVIAMYLLEDGHEVETAEDGAEALKKFQQGNFALVLTDRAMPELSGDQLAMEVKRLNSRCPVILLTGFGDLMNAEGECPQGIDSVVSKPFTMASLRSAVADVTKLYAR